MTTRLPKGASACTKTANMIQAWATDMRDVAAGLELASAMYRRQDVKNASDLVDSCMKGPHLRMPIQQYRERFK